jgi:toxin HigB-1
VITGFGDRGTEGIFHGESSAKTRKFPLELIATARRKLDMINAAHVITDLKVPPGNRLEALQGDSAGYHSIRINDRFRIVFRFKEGQASEVRIMDYH